MSDAPTVFISHSHADKERFVVNFATKLREKGVDAWVDQWEIKPGDSLVDKIFNEGLSKAQAIIVVVSENSVKSPWVKDELDAATVKRIEGKSRLIPLILDDVLIPEPLQHLLQVRIQDLNSYDQELNTVLNTIFDSSDKPPIGPAPAYTSTIIDTLPGLTKTDTLVMKVACEEAIRLGHSIVHFANIKNELEAQDASMADCYDSLEVLDNRYYIKLHRTLGHGASTFKITTFGFQEYAKLFFDDYDRIILRVASVIVNNDFRDSTLVISETKLPKMLVHHVIDLFKEKGWLGASEVMGGRYIIGNKSPELKRLLSR
ncbi:toll/interleukin-1 receptor domain-containing protein [bacterium]|nr:toll/interleukin-1 receptor domain-containing protein [bacterium]